VKIVHSFTCNTVQLHTIKQGTCFTLEDPTHPQSQTVYIRGIRKVMGVKGMFRTDPEYDRIQATDLDNGVHRYFSPDLLVWPVQAEVRVLS
jgi:hypothetical protein